LRPLAGVDRFYTEYYTDTVVGRLNSRNRNIQNIPLEARGFLMPDSGIFVSGDYSKEHLYILAEMSQDRDMLRVLRDPDPAKADIHQHTASIMGVPRRLAKTLNFAVVYGATAKTISEQAKIKDMRRCSKLLDDWLRTYKGVADWIKAVQREGLRTGWSEPTLFGRRIRIPEESDDAMRRKAVNYPVLGSDGEVIKRAIILCSRKGLGPPIMAATVHDSITWDGAVRDRIPVDELEMIPGFRIPFELKETLRWE
jgi:DNA polymerase I-like protein with 3'-5' exonuclease and polymerase domains